MAAKRTSPKKKAKASASKAKQTKKSRPATAKRSAQPKARSAAKPKAAKPRAGAAKGSAPKATTPKGNPRVEEIRQIIDVMVAAGAVELETEDGKGGRLRIRLKDEFASYPAAMVAPAMAPQAMMAPGPAAMAPAPGEPAAPPGRPANETEFVSPMVGTFYRAASPEAESFVSVGDDVGEDTTLCIIEAMKVMNEIKAEDVHGKVTEILVENGEPVEFGQPLFRVVGG